MGIRHRLVAINTAQTFAKIRPNGGIGRPGRRAVRRQRPEKLIKQRSFPLGKRGHLLNEFVYAHKLILAHLPGNLKSEISNGFPTRFRFPAFPLSALFAPLSPVPAGRLTIAPRLIVGLASLKFLQVPPGRPNPANPTVWTSFHGTRQAHFPGWRQPVATSFRTPFLPSCIPNSKHPHPKPRAQSLVFLSDSLATTPGNHQLLARKEFAMLGMTTSTKVRRLGSKARFMPKVSFFDICNG